MRFDEVTFAYNEDKTILPNFSLDIPAGQTIALVGTTGAGKSTLAKLISRFYDPSAGTVTLDGVDLRSLHPKDLRRAIVMVTQRRTCSAGPSPTTSRSGARMRLWTRSARRRGAVGADAFISALPDGYDTDVNKRGGRVSAGQRQLIRSPAPSSPTRRC
ncbi:ATP-binding cassette domain-containing protein [Microbacterium sp. NRRL B-14842]|uniref:ATP-binding cassette domain-containing protein n=1 Tax=Microbacterium sp. NRRL B-14842 TaxID=3162881 RepID=UPI003D2D445F